MNKLFSRPWSIALLFNSHVRAAEGRACGGVGVSGVLRPAPKAVGEVTDARLAAMRDERRWRGGGGDGRRRANWGYRNV